MYLRVISAMMRSRFAKSGRRGLPNYIDQAIHKWKDHESQRFELIVDGVHIEHDAVMVTIGNSDRWGHSARVTPLADSSDGILDITVVEDFKDIDIPILAFRLINGTVNMAPNIHCYKGREITINREKPGPAHADGDWFEAGEKLEIKVLKHALKVIVP